MSDAPYRPGMTALIGATTLAQAASTAGAAVFPVIAPRLAEEVGVAPATIGYMVSLSFGTAAIIAPFMSFAVPRWGAARATQVGLAVCAMAMAIAMSATLVGLGAAALLIGVGMTLMTPASGHLLFRFSPPQNRNLIFSIKQTGVPLGWAAMALAAPALTVAFGWRWALVSVLIVCVATAAAIQPVRARWDDDRVPGATGLANPAAGLSLIWRYPVLRWLSMASFCLTFVQLCLGTFLVTMLVAEAGYTLIAAGVMLSLVQLSGMAGRVLWGWIADRTGKAVGVLEKIAYTSAVCCLVMAFVGPAWPPPLLAALLVVFGLAAVGWNGLYLAQIAHSSPRGMVSVATSAAMVWNFGGILVGPALFAALYSHVIGSYAYTFGAITVVALAGAGLLTLAAAAARRAPE